VVAFSGGVWRYDPPTITSIAPVLLLPGGLDHVEGASSTTPLTITGSNFGWWPGTVHVGLRGAVCTSWTDDAIVCAAPPGVAAATAVLVTSPNNQTSMLQEGGSSRFVHYQPPAITSVLVTGTGNGTALDAAAGDAVLGSTRGGDVLYVTGSAFAAALPLSVSLWLVRGSGTPTPPWSDVPAPAVDAVVRCPLLGISTSSSTGLACTVPAGSGRGWHAVVVNHDGPDAFRVSATSLAQLSYRGPSTASAWAVSSSNNGTGSGGGVEAAGSGGGVEAAAAGGFLLHVSGRDFSSTAPTVTVGSLPCVVVGPVPAAHDSLLCEAPPRQVDTDSAAVVVTVDDQVSEPLPFSYPPPRISAVEPRVLDAVAFSGHLNIRGVHFGARYRVDLASNHTVHIGQLSCSDVSWVSDTSLSCAPPLDLVVGAVNVTVAVAGSASAEFQVGVSCPPGWYGQAGEHCMGCPLGALCPGRGSEPLAAPGYYPRARAYYAPCVPAEACSGGVSAVDIDVTSSISMSQPCARFYKGMNCALCAKGAFRSREHCVACPRTEWQLYLTCGLGFVVMVVGAVYVRKKRINLAGLSVGVVRAPE
jgi:hypothetical protein